MPITVPTWVWWHISSTRSKGRKKWRRSQVRLKLNKWRTTFGLLIKSEPSVCPCPAEAYNLPPQLPPRIINDVKDSDPKCSEQPCKSLQDVYLARLQHMNLSGYAHICSTNNTFSLQFMSCICFIFDLFCVQHNIFRIPEEHQVAIQEYFRTSVSSDIEQVQSGHHNLLALRKLITAICKNLNR